MKLSAIYTRVSTEEQARNGYSLADQIRSCRKHLLSMGISEIKEYVDDGYSGEYLERPALESLRKDLRGGIIGNVVIYDPDRLSRNLTNQLLLADEIEKSDVNLYFVTGSYDASPEGRLFFSIRGAISEFEKAKIRERTLRGKRSKALSGKILLDDDVYGYIYNKEQSTYVINPDEAEVIKLIFELYTTRNYGFASLSTELEALGIVNRKGKPFRPSTLCYMISNEIYAGTRWCFTKYNQKIGQRKRKTILRDKSEWISVSVSPIIDREIFERARECRIKNKTTQKRNAKHEYLLSGVIKCTHFGYAMSGVCYSRRNDKKYKYYVCTGYVNLHKCPSRKCIPSEELDNAVWSGLHAVSESNRKTIYLSPTANNSAHNTSLQKKLSQIKSRQAAIIKWVTDGTIEIDIAEKDLNNINKEVAALQVAISKLEAISKKSDKASSKIYAVETFDEKRSELLQSNFKIYAKRENGITTYSIRLE